VKSKEELEARGEVVCKQLEMMKNGSDASLIYDIGKKFLPQTPAEIQYYGKLMHKVNRADYVDDLEGKEVIEIAPAKAGFYQFSKQEGLFFTRDRALLYEEYKKAQDDTYKEYTEFRAKH
jgi:hypothetical protein